MQQLHASQHQGTLGRLLYDLPSVLYSLGAQHAAFAPTSRSHAGGYQPLQWRPEPQRHPPMRRPGIGEVALSADEVAFGVRAGIFTVEG